MLEIVWLRKAVDELQKIYDYLEQTYSEELAKRWLADFISITDLLCKYPSIGRISKKGRNIRFIVIKKRYRLYYKNTSKRLFIVFLFDSRKDPEQDIYH